MESTIMPTITSATILTKGFIPITSKHYVPIISPKLIPGKKVLLTKYKDRLFFYYPSAFKVFFHIYQEDIPVG